MVNKARQLSRVDVRLSLLIDSLRVHLVEELFDLYQDACLELLKLGTLVLFAF